MRLRILMSLACLAVVVMPLRAMAQVPDFESGQVLTADELNAMVGQINANTAAFRGQGGTTRMVNCDAEETIAQALSQAQPGDTIQVTGTCHETVTIVTSGLTLDGQGSTTIDGQGENAPVIEVIGARGVVLQNLTMQNGLDGIRAEQSAAVTVNGVTARDNADDGFDIRLSSSAVLTDCTAQSNGNDGFVVSHASEGTCPQL